MSSYQQLELKHAEKRRLMITGYVMLGLAIIAGIVVAIYVTQPGPAPVNTANVTYAPSPRGGYMNYGTITPPPGNVTPPLQTFPPCGPEFGPPC